MPTCVAFCLGGMFMRRHQHFVIPLAIVAVQSMDDAKHYYLASIGTLSAWVPTLTPLDSCIYAFRYGNISSAYADFRVRLSQSKTVVDLMSVREHWFLKEDHELIPYYYYSRCLLSLAPIDTSRKMYTDVFGSKKVWKQKVKDKFPQAISHMPTTRRSKTNQVIEYDETHYDFHAFVWNVIRHANEFRVHFWSIDEIFGPARKSPLPTLFDYANCIISSLSLMSCWLASIYIMCWQDLNYGALLKKSVGLLLCQSKKWPRNFSDASHGGIATRGSYLFTKNSDNECCSRKIYMDSKCSPYVYDIAYATDLSGSIKKDIKRPDSDYHRRMVGTNFVLHRSGWEEMFGDIKKLASKLVKLVMQSV
ncbi:hypothetical protein POM88_040197 [Heracleum sosnowskyi]|uniref:Uncharacterized protein n=1 Tax=Heracleum sosnowskyi TaxID=360622 RepID=A0AAD8M8I0_9APIA|nr:hypothetical protein POM88_040197 [Heracleum sosnowskyi]